MKTTNAAHIHRFRDSVALFFPGESETVYLPASLARDLGSALLAFAEDVDERGFGESMQNARYLQATPPTQAETWLGEMRSGVSAFNVVGAKQTRKREGSATYRFPDGSTVVVRDSGTHTYLWDVEAKRGRRVTLRRALGTTYR